MLGHCPVDVSKLYITVSQHVMGKVIICQQEFALLGSEKSDIVLRLLSFFCGVVFMFVTII